MGVKGLWKHLGPAARKIHIQDLEGKVIAIDASIWAIQFLSVLHQLGKQEEDLYGSLNEIRVVDGFLRRILKLLFFGIKPVFVFDGQTPALKKKTLGERRKARGKFGGEQEINYQKAAEKLLHKVIDEKLKNQGSKEAEKQVFEGVATMDKDDQLDLLDAKNFSELSSEINIDYIGDDVQQITQLLRDKYQTLFD